MTNRITIVEIERNADGEAFIDLTGIGRDEDNLYIVEQEENGVIRLIPAVAISKVQLQQLNEIAVKEALRTKPKEDLPLSSPPFAQPRPHWSTES